MTSANQIVNSFPSSAGLQHQDIEVNAEVLKGPECRICLMEQDSSTMISPCRCTGSMHYVHEDCLKNWINSLLKKSGSEVSGKRAHIRCELCEGKISFQVKSARQCKNKSEVVEKIREKTKTFILLLLLFLSNLVFFLALLAYIIRSKGFTPKSAAVLYPLTLSGEVVFFIVILVSTIALVRIFFLQKNFSAQKILEDEKKSNEESEKN